jgi:hypothetical protein
MKHKVACGTTEELSWLPTCLAQIIVMYLIGSFRNRVPFLLQLSKPSEVSHAKVLEVIIFRIVASSVFVVVCSIKKDDKITCLSDLEVENSGGESGKGSKGKKEKRTCIHNLYNHTIEPFTIKLLFELVTHRPD